MIYVVSGCPRSGTSLMMDCLRTMLGKDRILGYKFPGKWRINNIQKKFDDETQEQYNLRMYANAEYINKEKEKQKASEDLNPNGFWEDGIFSVRGLSYSQATVDIIKRIRCAEKPLFGKIVSQGLTNTDPSLVSKIIMMARDPHSVAKSQERLQRDGKYKLESGEEIDLFEDIVVHTPQMFIDVSIKASKWLVDNPEIEVLTIIYSDLISNPTETLKKIAYFLGEGDYERASKIIDPKLKRSHPENIKNALWKDADLAYSLFTASKYKELIEQFDDSRKTFNRQTQQWKCLRCECPMTEAHCKTCKASEEFRLSLINHAERCGIKWKELPCSYECAYDLDKPLISIEDSIKNNFWIKT